MDETENNAPEDAPKAETPGAAETAKAAAKEAAMDLKGEAEKTLGEIRSRGIKGFFDFEHMYFPVIARYIFIVLVLLSVLGMVLGVLSGLVAMFSAGVLAGIGAIIFSIVGGLLGIVFTRIAFEMILLGFSINEAAQEIRKNTRR